MKFNFLKEIVLVGLILLYSTGMISQEEIREVEDVREEIEEKGELNKFNYSANINTAALISSGENLPFWMHHNTRGRITETTNFIGRANGEMNYNFSLANVEIGGGLVFQDGLNDQFFIDELYAHFTNLNFYLTVGVKQEEELYAGLSSSNLNILWSLNSRAIPGLEFGTNGPLFLSGDYGIGFEGSWNGYRLEEERHVAEANIHRVHALLVYRTSNDFQIKAGINHFAQWGGISEADGPLSRGATDYLRVITGQEGEGGAILGNHLGSYELFLQKELPNLYLEFFYNYIYEDDNRMNFSNFPDGRYGLYFRFKDRARFVNSILYELTYTRNQSHKGWKSYSQDYFNNEIYRSGWTYQERVIGSPFFTYNRDSDRIVNNKFIMHHIGVSGKFSKYFGDFPYKLIVSGGRNDGRHEDYYIPNENVFYANYEMMLLQDVVNLSVQVGAEYNSVKSPLYGAGVALSKKF